MRPDRVLYWPAALASVWFVLLMRHNDLGPGLDVGAAIVFSGWLLSAGAAVVSCIGSFSARSWRRFVSAVILPLSVIVVAFNYQVLMRFSEYIHFRHKDYEVYDDLSQRGIRDQVMRGYELYNSGRISADR